ncbi:probable serine hydrolase isoform X1 [Teleopsis dalmanni]|uniref:probable serine hydrolase isoform X1 n=1 Tax=Teleopsis dalmanni TaxID=139649 RepID=UPI0018CE31AC|nr:probable serine hydrolase isoform X1 [Teleopsis dalmanni]
MDFSKVEYEDVRIPVPWGYISGRWYGNRNRRPILALHGWMDNLGTWDLLLPHLPKHIGILAIDFPGHGQSSHLPQGMQYHVIDYVTIVMHIIKEYNWKKVSLMGHSMGSVVVYLYAALYPSIVDLIVNIDLIKQAFWKTDFEINRFERNLIRRRNDMTEITNRSEPKSYDFKTLENIVHEGFGRSVDIENCKYLLYRNITKSQISPDKYYFSTDDRIKYMELFTATYELTLKLNKRIRNIPYFVIKGLNSSYLNEDSSEILKVLRKNNPHFEYYEIDGTHHLHLNNAEEVCKYLNPFLNRHCPAELSSWSIDDNIEDVRSKL